MRINKTYVLAGAGLYVGVAAAAYIRVKGSQTSPHSLACKHTSGAAFDALADTYDQQIGWDEKLMGISLMRWWLIRQAKGNILETSAGTGRNLAYYKSGRAQSVTMTDASKHMLWNAMQKHKDTNTQLPVQFCLADAQAMLTHHASANPAANEETARADRIAPHATQSSESSNQDSQKPQMTAFAPHQFDTVVDTFGLCSHSDPVAALKQMAAVCKPGGQLILLQHGRASWEWLNRRLDWEAAAHHTKWGCWWNRDILHLVQQAGLTVESCHRFHFGTTYIIRATPS